MNFQEVKKEVIDLFENIRVKRQKIEYQQTFYDKSLAGRVTFEHLDLGDIYERLVKVAPQIERYYGYLTSFDYGHDGVSLSTKTNSVYLAAICEMIKQEYNGGTHKTYVYVTGASSSNKYYKILESAFNSEGILPEDWNQRRQTSRRRYNDVLIQESGVPPRLVSNIISFFLIFWKYFKNMPKSERDSFFLELSECNDLSSYFIFQQKDKLRLLELYEEIKDYPSKVNQVISRLEEISNCFENEEFDLNTNVDDVYKRICERLHYDIFSIFPRKTKSLLNELYNIFMNRVTITKFKRIMNNFPPNTSIKLPNGKYSSVKQYTKVIFGRHELFNIVYEVVPDASIGLDELIAMPMNHVNFLDNKRFIYISREQFTVKYGGELYEPLKIIVDKFQGFVWFGALPKGFPIEIDGKHIEPEEEVYWNLNISYDFSYEYKAYRLTAYIPILRIYKYEYKNKRVIIQCDQSNRTIYRYIDRNGYLGTEALQFPLTSVDEGIICVRIFVDEELIDRKNLVLDKTYIFDRTTRECLLNTRKLATSGQLLIFTLYDCDMQFIPEVALKQYNRYSYLNYHIHRFSLATSNSEFQLVVNKEKWNFSGVIDIYLVRRNDGLNSEDDSISEVYSLDECKMLLACNGVSEEDYAKIIIIVEKDNYMWKFGFNEITVFDNSSILINNGNIKNKIRKTTNMIGKWYFTAYFCGKKLNTLCFNIIPRINIKPLKDMFMEGESVKAVLESEYPVFYSTNSEDFSCSKLIDLGKAKITDDKGLVGESLVSYVGLVGFDVEWKVEYRPKLWGIRLLDNNSNLIKGSRVDIRDSSDFEKNIIALFSEEKNTFELLINNVSKQKILCKGIEYISLKDYKQLFKEVNEITIVCDGQETSVKVVWQPSITFSKVISSFDMAEVIYDYYGPPNIVYYVKIADEGNNIQFEYEHITVNGENELRVTIRNSYKLNNKINIYILNHNYEICDQREIKLSFTPNTALIKDVLLLKSTFLEEVNNITLVTNGRKELKAEVAKLLKAAEEYARKELLLGE